MGSAETAPGADADAARQASDFELLANGGFAPLAGFMGSDDWRSVCETCGSPSGEIWPIPITLATDLECVGRRRRRARAPRTARRSAA